MVFKYFLIEIFFITCEEVKSPVTQTHRTALAEV